MELRDYQVEIASKAIEILTKKKLVCIFAEVRCGKTLMALEACKLFGAKRILFITKIKAFSSIKNDYKNFGYNYDLTVINRESLHKIESNDFDVIVVDEVHGYSAYPKPSKYQKEVRNRFGKIPMILLSGTPTPESYSQYYHIFDLSNFSPFIAFRSFYKWANEYVSVKIKHLGYAEVKDYSNANKELFYKLIEPYILTFTQSEAGFTTTVIENVLEVEMKPITYQIIERLKRDLIVTSQEGKVILADTGVKLQQKIHQLSSGTCKFEDGTSKVIDYSKAIFIQAEFRLNKIGIFYKFKEELNALKQVYGDGLTTDLDEFNSTDKSIALQVVSGREGISLKAADCLVFYNIDFSAVSYWQARDRLTTMDRKENTVYWIFSKGGIESKIYQSVKNKKDYTLSTFYKDNAGTKDTIKNIQQAKAARLECDKID